MNSLVKKKKKIIKNNITSINNSLTFKTVKMILKNTYYTLYNSYLINTIYFMIIKYLHFFKGNTGAFSEIR